MLTQTPAMTDFNGISISEDGFAVLVGNGGSIVHRDAGGNFMDMPSGTQQDLFDVHVVDESFAVAVGMDIGLIWDGTQWTAFFTDNSNTVYTSVWATPDKEAVIYNFGGAQFVFHTVYYPQTQTFLPVSGVSNLDVAFCGESDDIKIINQRGDIINVNNSLLPAHASQTQITLFDNSSQGAQFNAAWVPPGACVQGHSPLLDAYAIDMGRTFMQFSPLQGWVPMPVLGGTIPNDHNMTWLGGSGPDFMIATGFRAIAGGNEGIVWVWDGVEWAQDTGLPDNTPGLTDLGAVFTFQNDIFENGFEAVFPRAQQGQGAGPGVGADLLAAAENGFALTNDGLGPLIYADLEVINGPLTAPPYLSGQPLVYRISIINRGPKASVHLEMLFTDTTLSHLSNTCSGIRVSPASYLSRLVVETGAIETCDYEFLVTSTGFVGTDARGHNLSYSERNLENNSSLSELTVNQ